MRIQIPEKKPFFYKLFKNFFIVVFAVFCFLFALLAVGGAISNGGLYILIPVVLSALCGWLSFYLIKKPNDIFKTHQKGSLISGKSLLIDEDSKPLADDAKKNELFNGLAGFVESYYEKGLSKQNIPESENANAPDTIVAQDNIREMMDAYNIYMKSDDNNWLNIAHHIGNISKWVDIQYGDKRGAFSTRKVFLIAVFEHKDDFYFTGFCALRHAIRTFNGAGIKNINEIIKAIDDTGIIFQHEVSKPCTDCTLNKYEPVRPPSMLSNINLKQADIPELVSFGDSRFFQKSCYTHEIINYFGKASNKVSALFSTNGNPAVYVTYGWTGSRRFLVASKSWQYGDKPQNYKSIEEWIIKEWERLNPIKPHISHAVIGKRDMTAFFPTSETHLAYVFINDWEQHTYHLVNDVWNSTYKRTKNQDTENWLKNEWQNRSNL